MKESNWLNSTDPAAMLPILFGRTTDRKRRLFLCACCRRAWHLLSRRGRRAVEVGERFADGLVKMDAMYAASHPAYKAAVAEDFGFGRQRAAYEAVQTSYHPLRMPQVLASSQSLARAIAEWPANDEGGWRAMIRACRQLPPGRYEQVRAEEAAYRVQELAAQAQLVRCTFGNPFRRARVDKAWLAWNAGAVPMLAQASYEERDFDRLPILGDALEEAGCTDVAILDHCRRGGEHARGCWLVDLLLGKK